MKRRMAFMVTGHFGVGQEGRAGSPPHEPECLLSPSLSPAERGRGCPQDRRGGLGDQCAKSSGRSLPAAARTECAPYHPKVGRCSSWSCGLGTNLYSLSDGFQSQPADERGHHRHRQPGQPAIRRHPPVFRQWNFGGQHRAVAGKRSGTQHAAAPVHELRDARTAHPENRDLVLRGPHRGDPPVQAMLGFARRFRSQARPTAQWMSELREGERE